MNTDIGSTIKFHRKRLGLTLTELQSRTGINNGNLSKIERGQQSLTNDSMKAISTALGISLSELFSAHKEQTVNLRHNSAAVKTQAVRFASELETFDQISEGENVAIGTVSAVVDAVRGGIKVAVDEQVSHLFAGGELKGVEANPASVAAYFIEDDLMEPRLYKGDTVLMDLSDTQVPATGGVFCVVMDDETIAFRRLMPYPGRGLRIICDNPKYPEAVLDQRQALAVHIVGRLKTVRSMQGL